MSVKFAEAVAEGCRRHGIPVRFESGWDRRGNGQSSDYAGMSVHHTATGFGRAPRVLVNGRPDLPGPLCNSSGDDDGGITIIAAHPANHAGASGGRSMGPLPTTRSFNRRMWGHEIVYPGSSPMKAAQRRTALILGGVIGGILNRPNPEWVRAHAETSVTGKWDPGYAPGRTEDMAKWRRDIWPTLMAAPAPVTTPAAGVQGEIARVYNAHFRTLLGAPITEERTCPDGRGKYNHFALRNGSIYWYPGLGAWAVFGEIQKAWAKLGYERSRLGYPISHEFDAFDGAGKPVRRNNFQHGHIIWSPERGAVVVG